MPRCAKKKKLTLQWILEQLGRMGYSEQDVAGRAMLYVPRWFIQRQEHITPSGRSTFLQHNDISYLMYDSCYYISDNERYNKQVIVEGLGDRRIELDIPTRFPPREGLEEPQEVGIDEVWAFSPTFTYRPTSDTFQVSTSSARQGRQGAGEVVFSNPSYPQEPVIADQPSARATIDLGSSSREDGRGSVQPQGGGVRPLEGIGDSTFRSWITSLPIVRRRDR